QVISRLLDVGLRFRIDNWDPTRLAIFIHCPDEIIARESYKSRVLDWVNGIELEPPTWGEAVPELSSATRLRLIHELVTTPQYEGGAGITMDAGVVGETGAVGGAYVEAIFAPHEREFEAEWLKTWAHNWLLGDGDLTRIRNYAGEKVAMYFAFLQFYFLSLAIPSVVGVLTYFFAADYSAYYSAFVITWSIFFIALWDRRASQWADAWGTRRFSAVERIRPEFRPSTVLVDQASGERTPHFPGWRRWLRICTVSFPTVLVMVFGLGAIVVAITAVELFFYEFYDGPMKSALLALPTILYVAAIPILSSFYTKVSRRLNDFENYSTESDYDSAYTQKLFFSNSLLGFLSLFLVGWIFIPLAQVFGVALHQAGYVQRTSFEMGPEMLKDRLFYFVVTGQVINAFQEVVVPLITTKAATLSKSLGKSRGEKAAEDEELKFIRHVRNEFERPDYDIFEDFAEMVVQFGFLALFSVSWPLTPLVCFLNNFIELRSDAFKICKGSRRPISQRAENIGPWLKNLTVISWASSIFLPSLVTMYQSWDPAIPSATQTYNRIPQTLAAVLVAEHFYFLVKF
ncbi:calcium-activated chloride channel-domain-containing protein, partial [Blyttiomyces helicus]